MRGDVPWRADAGRGGACWLSGCGGGGGGVGGGSSFGGGGGNSLRHTPFKHIVPAIWAWRLGIPVTCCMKWLASCCACAITAAGEAGCVAESTKPGMGVAAHGGVAQAGGGAPAAGAGSVNELVAPPYIGSTGGGVALGVPAATAAASGDCGMIMTGGGPAGAG